MTDDWKSLSGQQRHAFTDQLLTLYGWTCCICHLPIETRSEASCQHLIARSLGGITSVSNCRPAHVACNVAVGNRVSELDIVHDGMSFFCEDGRTLSTYEEAVLSPGTTQKPARRPGDPARRVELVVGPPAAGKTSYVERCRRPGDRVVDFDAIARRLGSPVEHGHSAGIIRQAAREQRRVERDVAGMSTGRAFVIRVGADPGRRAELADRLGASVVVIDPGRSVVLERCRRDRPAGALDAVHRWYAVNPDPGPAPSSPAPGTVQIF